MSVRRERPARRPSGPWAWGSVLLVVVAQPVEQSRAREPPVLAELAAGNFARLRELGELIGLDPQQRGGFVERHDLGLLERRERVVADSERVVQALDDNAARAA